MNSDNVRMLVFCAFDDVMRKGAYSNLAIKEAMEKLHGRDKAFASALFYGCLEKVITLDFILKKHIKKRPKPVIKNILRFGVYQIYFMGSVPDHAAINTASNIASKLGKSGAGGFINGVLRSAARDKAAFSIPGNENDTSYLSIKHSFPEWIIEMWIKQLGQKMARELVSYEKEKGFSIYPNSLMDMDENSLEASLKKHGVDFRKSKMLSDVYMVGGDVFDTDMFKSGQIAVQGEASHLAAKVCVENNPKSVLDLCAAPGGKTSAMASFNAKASYTACDSNQNRVNVMERQFERLNVFAKTFCNDAAQETNSLGLFDTVLVDAPCSALGTVFTHPEVRYTKSNEDIKEILKVQRAILQNVSKNVNEYGRLIYATCTINKAENHDVVYDFLEKNKGFKSVFPKTFCGIIKDNRFDGCGVQLLPNIDGTAGFYIACLEKTNG